MAVVLLVMQINSFLICFLNLKIMIISVCSTLEALVIPKILYGSPTDQQTLKGDKVFSRNDLFEEDMIVYKLIHVIYYSNNLKI